MMKNVVDNYDTSYEFYIGNEGLASFVHNKNSFEITYNSYACDNDTNYSYKFTCEEFSLFSDSLKRLNNYFIL